MAVAVPFVHRRRAAENIINYNCVGEFGFLLLFFAFGSDWALGPSRLRPAACRGVQANRWNLAFFFNMLVSMPP